MIYFWAVYLFPQLLRTSSVHLLLLWIITENK
jgi:hypothetical protein